MSDWLQRHAHSHAVQLAGVALLSGAAVAGSIFGVQAVRRREAVEALKASIPKDADEPVGFRGREGRSWLIEHSLQSTARRS